MCGLLVLIASAVIVIATVPTNYQASAQVLLLPPTPATRSVGSANPYMGLPDGPTFTASLVASTLTNPDSARDLVQAGFTSNYSVSVPPQSGPVLVISVKDTDQSAALAMRDEIVNQVETRLQAIQDNEDAPADEQIVARPFNVSVRAEALAGSKVRSFAMIGGLIIISTLMVAYALDRRSVSRRAASIVAHDPSAERSILPVPRADETRQVDDRPRLIAGRDF